MMVVSKPELGNIPYAPIATEIPFEQIKPPIATEIPFEQIKPVKP